LNSTDDEFLQHIKRDLADTYDEELELELEDQQLDDAEGCLLDTASAQYKNNRHLYFREMFRMQAELVKLQDWVINTGQKVVIQFEGPDAAGKGGVIKRNTQRLNPRVCRVAALPAPNAREQTQWYFQRYVTHLPGAGEIVFFDRSWYNRAGVERVMGCAGRRQEESLPELHSSPVDTNSLWENPASGDSAYST